MGCRPSFGTCFLDPQLPAVHPVSGRRLRKPSGLLQDEVSDHLAGVQPSCTELGCEVMPVPLLQVPCALREVDICGLEELLPDLVEPVPA
eukprot:15781084-Heterocapsa_arctica.AAC.2